MGMFSVSSKSRTFEAQHQFSTVLDVEHFLCLDTKPECNTGQIFPCERKAIEKRFFQIYHKRKPHNTTYVLCMRSGLKRCKRGGMA